MNRAERRFRTQKKFDRKARILVKTWLTKVPCDIDEVPDHDKYRLRNCPTRDAIDYKDLEKNSPSMKLYKNTRTILDKSYWDKWEKRKFIKQSRQGKNKDINDRLNDNV